ncbi:MAG: hypothetical protein ACXABY_34320 [Candidatus Thorarchaeota archaeon]|jgi:hypothetical protein
MAKVAKSKKWRKSAKKIVKSLGSGLNNSPLGRAARGKHTKGYI